MRIEKLRGSTSFDWRQKGRKKSGFRDDIEEIVNDQQMSLVTWPFCKFLI